jgi:hypothetical protein
MTDSTGFGDAYHIIWFLPSARSVGEVRNYTIDLKRFRRIGISLDDAFLKKMNVRFLATEWTGAGPRIRVSTTFMAIPRSLREAGVWHEVGHIHHGHHFRDNVRGQSELGAPDVTVAADEPMPGMEEEADRFAVLQSNKEALTGFLEHLLRARPSGGRGGWNEIERRELEARIAAVRDC